MRKEWLKIENCAKFRANLDLLGFDKILADFDILRWLGFANLAFELNISAFILLLFVGLVW